ncbi:ATP-grasp fold domain protein [Podospora aff. communis PSN243]|uniref:ATP-grasp fold domain protein n=1 Tax=Podospora aff. communis PSN243 TaxID=3040156 RepID=A0AAV9H4R9_9PEZI|nr:ATP-grasp fold domain protein [Podospora aff. communis PSN243]
MENKPQGSTLGAFKFLLPAVDGYIVRNDIIQRRFLTCELAEEVVDFSTTGAKIAAFRYDRSPGSVLKEAMNSAVGVICVKPSPENMERLETEIQARLAFPWIVDKPLPRRRLALIDGKGYPHRSTGNLGIYRAAKALGVELVVVNKEGHWAQEDAIASEWRDEFLPCDITPDAGLPDRIVASLSNLQRPVDCITTYTDGLLPAVAKAAEKMGLFTNPSTAVDICNEKHRTRELAPEVNGGVVSFTAKTAADLERLLKDKTLQFPLVEAITQNQLNFPGTTSMIETHICGPEVDANFVLMDGEVLFSEINDDFPSTADTDEHGNRYFPPSVPPSFAELSTIIPSILPTDEIALLKSTLSQTLLRLGFRYGIFHLEARIVNSRMHFSNTPDGLDLVPRDNIRDGTPEPRVFLVEINPRAPGHRETIAIEYIYGIDYWALHMLSALPKGSAAPDDEETLAINTIMRSLSHPLAEEIQYPIYVGFIPTKQDGKMVSSNLDNLPEELAKYVVESRVHIEKGQMCKAQGQDGEWPFVAFINVAAKMTGAEGRLQARTMGERVTEAFKYVVE